MSDAEVTPAIYAQKRVIDAAAIDMLGHVNNVVWVDFIVSLADSHTTSIGWDWKRVRALGGLWIVRRHEVDYHTSAVLGDEIREETWVESIKGARSFRRSRFTRIKDEQVLVSALTTWAFCDPETQRPKRIPREILDLYRSTLGA